MHIIQLDGNDVMQCDGNEGKKEVYSTSSWDSIEKVDDKREKLLEKIK